MKQDLNIEEWNEIQEKARKWNGAHMALRMMRFGRKAPTATELRAQWLEQQRHEAEIRERFTTAERL